MTKGGIHAFTKLLSVPLIDRGSASTPSRRAPVWTPLTGEILPIVDGYG